MALKKCTVTVSCRRHGPHSDDVTLRQFSSGGGWDRVRGGADMQAAGRAAMTSASYGASGSFGATWPKKKKKRLPRPKPDAPVTMCWMQSPLLTRIPRPGSARPASASRPPQSLRMTLHYSRARMDAPTPVLDAHVPAHTRPATAGHLRSAGSVRGYGATMFFDATTREPLGGTVELRGRPSTARPDLGGSYNVTDTPRSARWSAHETAAQSEYLYLVEEAEAELAQMMAAERYVVHAPSSLVAGTRS